MGESATGVPVRNKPVIWLTGASSGIGWSTAVEAGKRGYRLALTARRVNLLEQCKEIIIKNGTSSDDILVLPSDVTQPEQLRKSYDAIIDRYGKIDILIANAGTYSSEDHGQLKASVFKELYEINFFGVLRCIELVLPAMKSRKAGLIAAVSSVAGYRALPRAANYGSSKSALTYLLQSLRFELEPLNIGVSVINPGFVKTPLTDRNDFKMPFLIDSETAGRLIMDGIESRRKEIHFPKKFTLLLKFLSLLPESIYNRIITWGVRG
jgi:short-subunit dehydrogenase